MYVLRDLKTKKVFMNYKIFGECYYDTHMEASHARAKYALASTHYIYYWSIENEGAESTYEELYA